MIKSFTYQFKYDFHTVKIRLFKRNRNRYGSQKPFCIPTNLWIVVVIVIIVVVVVVVVGVLCQMSLYDAWIEKQRWNGFVFRFFFIFHCCYCKLKLVKYTENNFPEGSKNILRPLSFTLNEIRWCNNNNTNETVIYHFPLKFPLCRFCRPNAKFECE